MNYFFSKTLKTDWATSIDKVKAALKKQGFGILTQTDIRETLKNKINVDFRPYEILGACHPTYAYKALQAESNIGTMLPCNVIIQQKESGEIEVSAIDPVASMKAVENDQLGEVAKLVQEKLKNVIASL